MARKFRYPKEIDAERAERLADCQVIQDLLDQPGGGVPEVKGLVGLCLLLLIWLVNRVLDNEVQLARLRRDIVREDGRV